MNLWKKIVPVLSLAGVLTSAPVMAASGFMPVQMRLAPVAEMPLPAVELPLQLERWAALEPEQRQQMRQQMREHWQQMPPEQREIRRQQVREQWQQLPPEERQRIRQEMREHRHEQRGGGDGGGRGGPGRPW